MVGLIAIFAALLAVLLPLLLYSFLVSHQVSTEDDFFLASEALGERGLFSTLAATWLLLGNVVVANMFLGMYFGWNNWWLVATWGGAFVLAGLHAPRIREKFGDAKTLHEFLAREYSFPPIKYIAATITASVALGIIALEIIVGMSLILPLFSSEEATPLAFLLGFALVAVVTLYSALGGLKAIVQTDKWQVTVIVLGMVSLLVISVRFLMAGTEFATSIDPTLYTISLESATLPGLPFYVGLLFLQVPLLLGDFGTWQRIRATDPKKRSVLAGAFNWVAGLNVVLWAIMVFAGVTLSAISSEAAFPLQDNLIYQTAKPVVDAIHVALMPEMGGGEVFGGVLVFFLVAGLTCALLSSADSYLLIALQTIFTDVFRVGSEEDEAAGLYSGTKAVKASRLAAALLAGVAYLVALAVITTGADLVSFVFVFFGSQAALAPLAVFALRDDVETERYRWVAAVGGLAGFLAPFAYGTWAVFVSQSGFHQQQGPFLVPVGAVVIPIVVFVVSGVAMDGPRRGVAYLKAFTSRYP